MNCEESHGFFNFTDDCFREDFVEKVKSTGRPAVDFQPVKLYEQWYAQAEPVAGFDQIQLNAFNIDYLYQKKRFTECIELVKRTILLFDKHNHLERVMVETMARCAVRLNDKQCAMKALELLNQHHQVEEPGLSLLKCQVYLHFREFSRGLEHGMEYLRLRPNDFLTHLLISRALKNTDSEISNEYYNSARHILLGYRRTEREIADSYLKEIENEVNIDC